MKFFSNVVGDSNDENNFPHKILLTNTQGSRLRKAFGNGLSANIKLSKTQFHTIGQSGRFSGKLLGPLLTTELLLIGNIHQPLAKIVLIQFGLTAAAPATDVAVHKKMFLSGNATLIISNEEMNDIMKLAKSLKESGLLIKGISETIKMKQNNKEEDFLECC